MSIRQEIKYTELIYFHIDKYTFVMYNITEIKTGAPRRQMKEVYT